MDLPSGTCYGIHPERHILQVMLAEGTFPMSHYPVPKTALSHFKDQDVTTKKCLNMCVFPHLEPGGGLMDDHKLKREK